MQSEQGESARKNSGTYENPAIRIEIRDSPVAEFVDFLKLLTNHLSRFK
jgi:hypothetical protein